MRNYLTWGLRFALPPLALLLVVLVTWDAATQIWDIKKYLLPRPADVLRAAWEHRGRLAQAALLTGEAALAGFLLSLAVGVLVACVFSQSKIVSRSVYPYAIFLQTVPIVAIAPLVVVWFDYGFQSVVVVAFIISLFPIITNATAGLTTLDPNLLELFALAGASRWQTLVKLRMPNCVPHLVTGAKTSSGLSVVGAIVGEIFAGSAMDDFGLGYLIDQLKNQLKTDYLFAAILASTLVGILIFGSVSLLGASIVARWQGGPDRH